MDPLSIGGLAIGLGSLAFDVFDHSIKLFRFFSSVVEMPEEFGKCRLQLMIEYNRLLAWGDAVGLVRAAHGSDIATSLGTNANELCAIVARIGRLLEEFRELNNRWKNEATSDPASELAVTGEMAAEIDFSAKVSGLAVIHTEKLEERKKTKRMKRLAAWASKGAATANRAIAHPSRVRWVLADKDAFEVLLVDLHKLIDRIHELMDTYQKRQIQETTAKTYLEMVVLRNDLRDIKDMFQAVVSMMEVTKSSCSTDPDRSETTHETLRDLLLLKEIKCVSDEILSRLHDHAALDVTRSMDDAIKVKKYDNVLFNECFTPNTSGFIANGVDPYRPRGFLNQKGTNHEVWVEWRAAEYQMIGSVEENESIVRTATLAAMLSIEKPRHLLSPTCVGYVDDRRRNHRVGWIYKMPQGSTDQTRLRTLHSMLGNDSCRPTIAERVSLAWRLASSLLYLHTVGWLHKGVHSGNIVFSTECEAVDFGSPIMSGFEYSRPQSNKTTSRNLDPTWDIYRWPSIQNEAPRDANFRKTFDIYSLGLLLLEIAHWQPLHKLMAFQKWPTPSAEYCRIRAWLLDEEDLPPFKNNPVLELQNFIGDKYWAATRRCLVAYGEQGLHVQEGSDQSHPEIGVGIQTVFTELVVEQLKAISV
ncbi:hypothetical protein M409DRAFT_62852 [Zasmidium cellare ATCC 36951]|uniref:Uncharacterized protein n=1 Tax=Zasmidium cellare ATCC 36951 TaxID=1080233 RepID=A0A6A6D6M6_ZASCE|nr:uncharacterized protein M409DRAFT_62852 [Zasmidium cellare ATCC 36951]KAF2173316.1 hypothetical protein M409DRAFT_62852 [Zasmidium cellare ATCC 36951]